MMNKIQLSGDGQLMEVKLPCQLIIYNSWVLTAISKETPSGKWKLKAFFFCMALSSVQALNRI